MVLNNVFSYVFIQATRLKSKHKHILLMFIQCSLLFSDVFPLHKIIHLWDKLILGDNSYPLFIGISVLQQLKTELLNSCFNECILLFSDLPDIVMETCVVESLKMYLSTPKSVTHRKNVLNQNEPSEFVSK